jgi:hypothetical protein
MFDNACCIDLKLICFTETWLNDLCSDQTLFPDFFTILGVDKKSSSKSRGGGVLIAACPRVRACKRRHKLTVL